MTTSAPRLLSLDPSSLPRSLVDQVAWYPAIIKPKKNKPGKWDKIPGDPTTGHAATWSDPSTRCTFGAAFMAYESGRFPGIGYMMHGAGVIGIDLDDSIDEDGSIKPWAQEIVDSFAGAYWERSISGTGLRGFCLGVLPDDVHGRRSKVAGCTVEIYSDERFLVATGQALQLVDDLPTLQPAVDALYARLTTGGPRVTGKAVKTGLTGRVTDLTTDELAIVEDVMGGRWSATMSEIWFRDELDAAGASESDWALEKEIAYWAIRRGYSGDNLALVVERIMRAGPFRRKWDEARGGVSWLAQDVANAIKTTQDRLNKAEASGPTVLDFDAELHPETAPADETLEQTVIRLERENKQLRATNAVQMTVINGERVARETAEAGKRAADELVTAMYDTLAIPDEQLAARPKLVSLALAREAASRNSRGIFNLSNIALAGLTGLSEKVVSQIMQDLPARDGTPFERIVTREWVTTELGITEPRSIAQVRITTPDQTTVSVIRALPTIGGPSDKEMRRKAKTQARAAAAKEAKIAAEVGKRIGWGWCSSHEETDVTVKGHCSRCGEVVGERMMTVDEFRILNPEIRDSAVQPPLPVDVVTLPAVLRDSGSVSVVRPFDMGDPGAPKGSPSWCRWLHFEIERRSKKSSEAAESLGICVRAFREVEAFKNLADRKGQPFASFEAYRRTPFPYGLAGLELPHEKPGRAQDGAPPWLEEWPEDAVPAVFR